MSFLTNAKTVKWQGFQAAPLPGTPAQSASQMAGDYQTLLGQAPKQDATDTFLKALNATQFGPLGQGRKSAFSTGAADGLAPPSVGAKTLLGG